VGGLISGAQEVSNACGAWENEAASIVNFPSANAMMRREHPELSEGLCVEMMTRQLADAGAHTLQHQVLTALTPWMENLIFRPRWEGEPRCCLGRGRWRMSYLFWDPL